jgi:hypothetical protein
MALQTIQLRINDKIYDKLIWLLSKFSKDEIEIFPESEDLSLTGNILLGNFLTSYLEKQHSWN